MSGQSGAGSFAEPGHDVNDSFRNAGFEEQLAQTERRKGSLLGGLEDDAVAGGEGGAEFPCGHEEGEIPRDNLGNNADGLTQGEGMEARAGSVGYANGNGVAFDLSCPASHVLKQVGGQGDR